MLSTLAGPCPSVALLLKIMQTMLKSISGYPIHETYRDSIDLYWQVRMDRVCQWSLDIILHSVLRRQIQAQISIFDFARTQRDKSQMQKRGETSPDFSVERGHLLDTTHGHNERNHQQQQQIFEIRTYIAHLSSYSPRRLEVRIRPMAYTTVVVPSAGLGISYNRQLQLFGATWGPKKLVSLPASITFFQEVSCGWIGLDRNEPPIPPPIPPNGRHSTQRRPRVVFDGIGIEHKMGGWDMKARHDPI